MEDAMHSLSKQQLAVQRRSRIARGQRRGQMIVHRITSDDVYLPPKNQVGTNSTYGTQHRVTVIKTAQQLSLEVAY